MGEINLDVTEHSRDNKKKSFKAKMNLNFFHLYFCTCGSEVAPLCSITVSLSGEIVIAISHAKQSVDKAICPCRLCPRADTVLRQMAMKGVWDLHGSCVCFCVCVDVCVCVHTIYIHTWLPICFVLHVLNADIFSDCVCVCFCLTASVFITKNHLRLFFLFHFLFSDTHSDDFVYFSIKRSQTCRRQTLF